MTLRIPSIIAACRDPELFGRWFKNVETWQPWLCFLSILFGLPTTDAQREFYTKCTGRAGLPADRIDEAWLICGRRAGKSFILALTAVYLATFRNYREHLAPGERATILILATDRRQSRVIYRYIRALVMQTPLLRSKVVRETQDILELDNSVSIEIATASYRTTRGYTLVACLCDEIARWPSDDAAEPDYEILDAVRPGMGTIPGSLLLCASSPHRKRGAMWDAFTRSYGTDDPGTLVWKAQTRTMNATFSQDVIDRAEARDPAFAAAEYGAEFRDDIEGFATWDIVRACVDVGVHERPFESKHKYTGYTDPAGGSGSDSMTLTIGHLDENEARVVDLLREVRPPFSPNSTVKDFAADLKRYRISKVTGDRYAGEWPREQFKLAGISYQPAELPRSQLYGELLPCLNAGTVRLLDNARLVSQITGLERRHSATRDVIDHAPGSHDDLANVVAGVVAEIGKDISRRRYSSHMWVRNVDASGDEQHDGGYDARGVRSTYDKRTGRRTDWANMIRPLRW